MTAIATTDGHPARTGNRPSARARRTASSRTPADLRRLDADLETLERAEAMLNEALALRPSDPRSSFELAHRAQLRTAGVVVDRANRERVRRLPLNVWTALTRCGAMNRRWAEEAQPFVAERARLAGRADAIPDPVLLDAHLNGTQERIAAIRAETVIALVPAGSS